MHIVIMGCGRVGSGLARALAKAGHSVAIIDREPAAFRRLGPDFHGQQVQGVGFDRDTLIAARISEAHAFAAVSSGDNSNIIAARVAREQFGVETVVARIYDPKRAQVYERLGIPTVATVPWTTDRLLRAVVPDGLISEWRDPSGTITVVNIPYHRGWIGRGLSELESHLGVRAAFVVRFGTGLLPTRDTVVQEGDLIYAAVLSAETQRVADLAEVAPDEAGA
ncbi:TrkA family potassium uptake protein [Nakamurella sp. YIM 132087]|uniref:TrkA family potassium uptake protein n=1 Tax=Nakamurella alba TaxID=2665158 RepID=A0A7K1FQL2_9ACTN|nr:TrkA family potassium uptake protein [Nakamurella alba]MTD16442.1 TrkA family potassium uptake protein [Nakamurella alba]